MRSKVEADDNVGEAYDEKNRLFKEVVSLSKVLDRTFSRSSSSTPKSRSKSSKKVTISDPKSKPDEVSKEENLPKEKKSIWDWKPLKALSLTRSRKFNCSFSLQIHLIEGFPSSFDDSSICVYWKRKDDILVTPPAKVVQGVAKFEHRLTYTCIICASRSGHQNSAKYEAKHSSLYASMVGAPEQDFGKHRVDLTRFLPLTLEEILEEKNTGKWTTSFRLSGPAKGAVMNVSFGYVMIDCDKANATGDNHGSPNVLRQNSSDSEKLMTNPSRSDQGLIRSGSLPSFICVYTSQNVDQVKDLHEVLPLSKYPSSGDIYKTYIEEKTYSSPHEKQELGASEENLEPILKSDVYSLSDIEKDKLEDHPVNKGETYTPVHGKPEFGVFQEKMENSGKENAEEDEDNNEFTIVDKGIEFSLNEHVKLEEYTLEALLYDAHTLDSIYTRDTDSIQESFEDSVKGDTQDEVNDSSMEKAIIHEVSYKEDDTCTKEILLQEIESALKSVSELEALALESPNITEAKSECKMRKSQSLDDVANSVASEFLSMVGIENSPLSMSFESDPESPRERLLRQFMMDTKCEGFSLFDSDMGGDIKADGGCKTPSGSKPSKGVKSSSLLKNLHGGHPNWLQHMSSKQRAQLVEDLETEALMKEWGLKEKDFQHSPPRDTSGFGSPIQVLPQEHIILPPLAEGLGPFIQTKDGGFLRSMSPSLFVNAKNGGKLIMQISNPVVIPAEMGSGIMGILQCLASMGIEKLSMQAKKLMPLEDIRGKTMQQIAWEAMPAQGKERQCQLKHNLVKCRHTGCVLRALKGTSSLKFCPSSVGNQTVSEFVSLEALAPLAMEKIEALSMEGLRIESGLSEEDAPSHIIAKPFGDTSSALHGKEINISGSIALDGAASLKLLDIKDTGSVVDGMMALSLTLDEWMRLDSGEEIDDIDNISEHTSKLLAAHHANSFESTRASSKGERKRDKDLGRKRGLLGNNFTVALMVQLRDPLRNYEPVGTPMLALIQVERLFAPPKQKLYKCLRDVGNMSDNDDDDECEIVTKVEMKENKEEDSITKFRITDVHIAGLKAENRKKKLLCGGSRHHNSGSRWLLANGMGKTKKNPLMKSKVASEFSSAPPPAVTTKVQSGDTLWSISSRIYGAVEKWMELTALHSHTRNPNIIIPDVNETPRIR